jgi:hypothetical protein
MRGIPIGTIGLAILLLGACAKRAEEAQDTDDVLVYDNEPYDGEYQIASVDHACVRGDPDMWTYQILTDGWAGSVALHIVETRDADWASDPGVPEEHELGNTAYDAGYSWDEYALVLYSVQEVALQQNGATTLWDCNYDDAVDDAGGSLAWMALMLDSGDPPGTLHCAIWGHEADQYYNFYQGRDCTCIDSDADCTD